MIRHTQPQVEKGICYGQTDLDIATSFEDEVNRIKEKLNTFEDFKVLSSPLKRCLKLSGNLFPSYFINLESRIMELNFGEWEMVSWQNMDQEVLKSWGNNFITTAPPGGECFSNLFDRVQSFWSELDIEKQNYAIVTHDGVIRSILSILLEIPLKKAFSIEIPYGTVIRLQFFDKNNCRMKFL